MEEIEIIKMVPHVVRSTQRKIWIGYDEEEVIEMANVFEPKGEQRDVFGSGDASGRIVKIFKEAF